MGQTTLRAKGPQRVVGGRHAVAVLISLSATLSMAAASEIASFEDAAQAWRDSSVVWRTLPESEARERTTRFLLQFDVADLLKFCSASQDPQAEGQLEGFIRARLSAGTFPVPDLVFLLTDPTVHASCKAGLMRHVNQIQDDLGADEREAVGEAFLTMADSGEFSPGIVKQIEIAAAQFTTSDAILERMEGYLAAEDEELRGHAVAMLARSPAPRSRALLRETIQRYLTAGTLPSRQILLLAAPALGEEGFAELEALLTQAKTPAQRLDVLEAMAGTGDPRVLPLLLAEYGDGAGGIRDSTFALADSDERNRYFQLYRLTRILEPQLLDALAGGQADLRWVAVELLDRESRHGVAQQWAQIRAALSDLCQSREAGEAQQARITRILEQFEAQEARLERRRATRWRR